MANPEYNEKKIISRMKLYPIFIIVALICFGMAGYNYSQYSQTEPTQELVPCYDFHGNVISGAECIKEIKENDYLYYVVVGLFLVACSIALFNEYKEIQ